MEFNYRTETQWKRMLGTSAFLGLGVALALMIAAWPSKEISSAQRTTEITLGMRCGFLLFSLVLSLPILWLCQRWKKERISILENGDVEWINWRCIAKVIAVSELKGSRLVYSDAPPNSRGSS